MPAAERPTALGVKFQKLTGSLGGQVRELAELREPPFGQRFGGGPKEPRGELGEMGVQRAPSAGQHEFGRPQQIGQQRQHHQRLAGPAVSQLVQIFA